MIPALDLIDLFTDAMRWWGVCAGLLGLDDFRRRWMLYRARREHPVVDLWLDSWAKLLVCVFVVGAGFCIPLLDRVDWFAQRDLDLVMAAMWPLLSGAVWLYVISRAARAWIMAGVAFGLWFAVVLAATVTATG